MKSSTDQNSSRHSATQDHSSGVDYFLQFWFIIFILLCLMNNSMIPYVQIQSTGNSRQRVIV